MNIKSILCLCIIWITAVVSGVFSQKSHAYGFEIVEEEDDRRPARGYGRGRHSGRLTNNELGSGSTKDRRVDRIIQLIRKSNYEPQYNYGYNRGSRRRYGYGYGR